MGTIARYFTQMAFPSLLGALLWLVSYPWRKSHCSKMGYSVGSGREKALFLLFLFSAGLSALTLTPPNFWSSIMSGHMPPLPAPFQGDVNLVPVLQSISLLRYYIKHGLWDAIWINFPGNILMFLPFGFFAGLLMDKPKWWKSTLWTAALSLFIEVFQLFISRGTDVDDLILNALGGLFGFWSFIALHRLLPDVASKCAKV